MPRVIYAVAGLLGVIFACGQVVPPPGLAAPINACPSHVCSTYVQPGAAPSCNAGVCTVATAMDDLVLVLSLPTDAFVAPGRTYVASLSTSPTAPDDAGACGSPDSGAPEEDDAGACVPPHCSPPCCALPGYAQDNTSYEVDPKDTQLVGRYLGNPTAITTLPIEATYRRMWGSNPNDAGDAVSQGLPVEPVTGQLVANTGGDTRGPRGSEALQARAYLQPGCYERTLQPYAPFAEAYPPDIHSYSLPIESPPPTDNAITFDTTLERGPQKTLPTFEITRPDGLDGWTAHLRDQTTKRLFSNVAPLSGSVAEITLATSHIPTPTTDALTHLELVVAPPPGIPMPTYVAAPIAGLLVRGQPYPALPTPVTMTGRVLTLSGTPVEAELVFTATDISDPNGAPYPSSNFEFVVWARASADPKTGASAYSVLLPRGEYQITVLPRDPSGALTVVSRRVGGERDTMTGEDIVVAARTPVQGSVHVADGRPLADALVEAVPTQCSPDSQVTAVVNPSAPCMPRPAQTTTADDGSFALAIDPGDYLLRVRPADGSHLPWVMKPIEVGLGPMNLAPVVVPAPVHVSMTFTDARTYPDGVMVCMGNCIGKALVRVFTDPSRGSRAVQLGQAITDTSGHFEMDLAPPAQ